MDRKINFDFYVSKLRMDNHYGLKLVFDGIKEAYGGLKNINNECLFYPKGMFCSDQHQELYFFRDTSYTVLTVINDDYGVRIKTISYQEIKLIELVFEDIHNAVLTVELRGGEKIKFSRQDAAQGWSNSMNLHVVELYNYLIEKVY